MKLAIITAHAGATCFGECALSWGALPLFVEDGRQGMLPAFNSGLGDSAGYDILAYFHDDLRIDNRDWYKRVLKEFEDPKVGLVGFGGATGHGTPGLYRDPYDYRQLARSNFLSNMEQAEIHGARFTGERDVAVLDGFSLIVRSDVLVRAGGWPVEKLVFHCYDYWLCAMTHRLGYRIRVVGVPCHHYGGRTSVDQKMDPGNIHEISHRYIYDEFRDVLPWRCA